MDEVIAEHIDVTASAEYQALWRTIKSLSIDAMLTQARIRLHQIAERRGAPRHLPPAQCDDFIRSILKTRACQACWNVPTLGVTCLDCGLSEDSVICFACYCAGNHENHRVSARYYAGGNCDCGDEQLWKRSGFCPCHPGPSPNPDQDDLTLEERRAFRAIFRVMIEQLPFSARYQTASIATLCSELVHLISLGDSLRRCCALSFESFSLFDFLLQDCDNLPYESVLELLKLFGALISDNYFRVYFARQIVPRYGELVERYIRIASVEGGGDFCCFARRYRYEVGV